MEKGPGKLQESVSQSVSQSVGGPVVPKPEKLCSCPWSDLRENEPGVSTDTPP